MNTAQEILKMPRNWKSIVAERLKNQGVKVTEAEVYNLAKGRKKDVELEHLVLATAREVGEAYTAKMEEVKMLREKIEI